MPLEVKLLGTAHTSKHRREQVVVANRTIANRRNKFLSRSLGWFFLAAVTLAVSSPLQAVTYEVGGCKTGKSYVNFTTISLAVIGVPAGSKIEVCPGVYPEQVTITQPLTLQGITLNNSGRAIIVINPNGVLTSNVTSITGESLYAQVLVQNVNPPGAVNITGITIDGAGGNAGCSMTQGVVGVFYASGTTGTVNESTVRNQQSSGCGYGVWLENGADPAQTITVENSSFHNIDAAGINAVSDQTPPTLSATIQGNFLYNASFGIATQGINGAVTGNFTTGGSEGISVALTPGAITISGNVAADTGDGIVLGGGATAESNKISNTLLGFGPSGGVPGPLIQNNVVMNAGTGFAPVCAAGTITKNVFNDLQTGFEEAFQSPTGNTLYNVDTIQTNPCP